MRRDHIIEFFGAKNVKERARRRKAKLKKFKPGKDQNEVLGGKTYRRQMIL